MAVITAQQLKDEQTRQIKEVIDALRVVSATVESMRGSKIGDFDVWFGGLPQEVTTPGGQSFYYAGQLATLAGIPVDEVQNEAAS